MSFWKQTALYGTVALVAGSLGFFASQGMRQEGSDVSAAEALPNAGAVERQPAADFSLPDLEGKSHSLNEWRGQWLLLNFWASWCAPCMAEIPVLIAAQSKFSARGLQVLGVAMDDPDMVRSTMKDKAFNYPSLVGDEAVATAMEKLGNSMGVLPYTVLIDPDGIVQQTELGGIDAAKIDTWAQNYLRPAKP